MSKEPNAIYVLSWCTCYRDGSNSMGSVNVMTSPVKTLQETQELITSALEDVKKDAAAKGHMLLGDGEPIMTNISRLI